jgi:hypothetical protein
MADGTGHDRIILSAPDGRQLQVLPAGPPEGMPLVFHNGTPSGLVDVGPMTRAASARGLLDLAGLEIPGAARSE